MSPAPPGAAGGAKRAMKIQAAVASRSVVGPPADGTETWTRDVFSRSCSSIASAPARQLPRESETGGGWQAPTPQTLKATAAATKNHQNLLSASMAQRIQIRCKAAMERKRSPRF